jgi:hypothetical protein
MKLTVDLGERAIAALQKIGSDLADARPDLNQALTDDVVISAALFASQLGQKVPRPFSELLGQGFTIALHEQGYMDDNGNLIKRGER